MGKGSNIPGKQKKKENYFLSNSLSENGLFPRYSLQRRFRVFLFENY